MNILNMIVKNKTSGTPTVPSSQSTITASSQNVLNQTSNLLAHQNNKRLSHQRIEDVMNHTGKAKGGFSFGAYIGISQGASHGKNSNPTSATTLLNNLFTNKGDKENAQQAMLQTNGSSGTRSDTSSNALYQFLKNKHLSQEVQKRMSNDLNFQSRDMKDKGKHSKAGGSAYIDMNQLKKKEVSQSKCQSVLESISDNNMLTMKNQANSNSSQSKDPSSDESSPEQRINSGLKKVNSVSHFQKTSCGPNQSNARCSSSINNFNTKSPQNNQEEKHSSVISNSSSKLNLFFDNSMNLSQNLSSGVNKTTKAAKKPINNNSLTSNWMNVFLEQYDQRNPHGNRTKANRPSSSSQYNSYQKFINNNYNSATTGYKAPTHNHSKPNSISLNKSMANVNKSAHQKTSSQTQQRRGSAAMPSSSVYNNVGYNSVNKSYQNGSSKGYPQQKGLKKNMSFLATGSMSQIPTCLQNNGSSSSFSNTNTINAYNPNSGGSTTAATSKQISAQQNLSKQQYCSPAIAQQQAHNSSKYGSIGYQKNLKARKSSVNSQTSTCGLNKSTSNAHKTFLRMHQHHNASQLGASEVNKSMIDMPNMGPISTKNSQSFFEGDPRNKTLNGLGRIKTNDKEGYQFDEILEKYDRQVETQNIPVKTINITSHHSSPEKSQQYFDQNEQCMEALISVMQSQKKPDDKEKQINTLFNEIIAHQRNKSDQRSLQIIKEYYSRHYSHAKQYTSEVQKLQEGILEEKHKRIAAETQLALMNEEANKLRSQISKPDPDVLTMKQQESKTTQQKQMATQQATQQIYSSQSQIASQSAASKASIHSVASVQKNNSISHHYKNKSVSPMIPKLDLSKLKRDVDQESLPQLNEPEELSDDDLLDTEDIQVQNYTEEALDTFDIQDQDLLSRKSQVMMMLGEMNRLDQAKTESGMESSQRPTSLKKLPIASKQKLEGKKPVIPPLDFSQLKGDHAPPKKQVQASKQQPSMKLDAGKKPSFKLNLDIVKQQRDEEVNGCFQDEFMSKLDEYSQSWREAAIKEQRH